MSWIPTWLRPIPAPNSKLNDEAPTPALPKSTEPAPQQQSYALVSSQSPPPATSTTLSKTVEEGTDAGPIVAIPFTGFALGFGAGVYQSAKRASLVFMAENAHRRPDTVQGWYFYNKTKNYRVLLAGFTGGLKTGTRVGLWTLAFVGIEYGVTQLQHEQAKKRGLNIGEHYSRWIASGVAGLGIASGASLLYRLPGPVARRAILLGILAGSSIGGLRDAQHYVAMNRAVEVK